MKRWRIPVAPVARQDGLVIFGCIGSVLLFYLLVWQPWSRQLDAQQQQLASMVSDWQHINGYADQLLEWSRKDHSPQTLLARTGELANEYGVAPGVISSSSADQITLTFQDIPVNMGLKFLEKIDAQFEFSRVAISTGSAAGTITMQITIHEN